MRATSPQGDASFEGVVAWSGELGFGVRAPEVGQSTLEDHQPATNQVDVAGHSEALKPDSLHDEDRAH